MKISHNLKYIPWWFLVPAAVMVFLVAGGTPADADAGSLSKVIFYVY